MSTASACGCGDSAKSFVFIVIKSLELRSKMVEPGERHRKLLYVRVVDPFNHVGCPIRCGSWSGGVYTGVAELYTRTRQRSGREEASPKRIHQKAEIFMKEQS